MRYKDNSFIKDPLGSTKDMVSNDMSYYTFGFHYRTVHNEKSRSSALYIGFVSQKFDGTYKRKVRYFCFLFQSLGNQPKEKLEVVLPGFKNPSEKLKHISDSFEMIAILVTKRLTTYVLFRFSSAIKYCTLDEVNTHFNQVFYNSIQFQYFSV